MTPRENKVNAEESRIERESVEYTHPDRKDAEQIATILDHPVVSSRYFSPRRAPFADPYWILAADGSRLACSYRAVHANATTVVYFHGNREVVADYLPGFPD
jgi:hypothetical protein